MLAERIELLEKGKESRVAIVGETKRKKKSSAVKKSKRKYRLLAEEKAAKAGKENAQENFEEDALDDEGVNPEDMESPRQDSSKIGGGF